MEVPRALDGLRKDLYGLPANDSYDISRSRTCDEVRVSPHAAIGGRNDGPAREMKKTCPLSLLRGEAWPDK